MKKKEIYIFLFDGFSDWEIAYLTPEIAKSTKVNLKTFSLEGSSVTSMGGLKIIPDLSVDKLSTDDMSLLILPGGVAWEQNKINGIEKVINILHSENKTIAAICGATIFLAGMGYLDHVRHTSNDLNYLKNFAPNYHGENNYQTEFAVSDKNIITANGIAPIEFAREIFKNIHLFHDEDIEKWYQLFKNGIWSE